MRRLQVHIDAVLRISFFPSRTKALCFPWRLQSVHVIFSFGRGPVITSERFIGMFLFLESVASLTSLLLLH